MRETAIEIAESVRQGQRKAVEVLDEALAAVAAGNERLGAFVHVDEALARQAAAEAVDATVAAGRDPGPVRRRADRGQGPRGLRRHAHLARVAGLRRARSR